jgi:hypothetical protein
MVDFLMSMSEPKQITLRNVSPELARRLKALARARGESLNGLVLHLLEGAVGVDARRRRLLERYATWTEEDQEEFDQALSEQRVVDDALWS